MSGGRPRTRLATTGSTQPGGSRDTWGRQLNGESDEAEPAAGNRLAPTDPGRFRWDRLARSAYDGQDHLARHRDASIHGYYISQVSTLLFLG